MNINLLPETCTFRVSPYGWTQGAPFSQGLSLGPSLVLGRKKEDTWHARLGAVAKYWFCLVSPSLGIGLSGYKGHPPLNTLSPDVYSGHWVGFQREAGVCREREVQAEWSSQAKVSGSKRSLRRTFLDCHQKVLW